MRLLDDGGKKMVFCFIVYLILFLDFLLVEDFVDISSFIRVDRVVVLLRFMIYIYRKGKIYEFFMKF